MEKIKSHKSFDGDVSFYKHESLSTKTTMKFSIFMPEGNKPDGCVIWLSGLTCNEENFITKAGAQKYLSEHNMMVICPDTSPRELNLPNEHESWDFGSGAGFYLNATTDGYKEHYKMFDYITKDLYEIIVSNFNIDTKKISISGHSMGGHGALIIGLTEPENFASISAFSPIVNPINCPWGQKAFTGYLGEKNKDDWKKYDTCELLKLGSTHPHTILVDQGEADEFKEKELLTNNLEIASSENNQPIILNYREGYDHSYYFISTFIDSHLKFHKDAWKN